MTQTVYIDCIAEWFRMDNCNPVGTPLQKGFKPLTSMSPTDECGWEEMAAVPYREAVGSLLYVAMCTWPDISYAVCSLAWHCSNPGREHWAAVKNVIKYLCTTWDMGLKYTTKEWDDTMNEISAYQDSSHNNNDDAQSTLGQAVLLFSYLVCWRSKLSSCIAQLAMELELFSLNGCTRESQWLHHVMQDVITARVKPILIHCDNNPMIQSCQGPRVNDQNKHIQPKYFYVVQLIESGVVRLKKVPSAD